MTAFVLGVSRIQYLFERRKHSAEARMYLFERRKPSEKGAEGAISVSRGWLIWPLREVYSRFEGLMAEYSRSKIGGMALTRMGFYMRSSCRPAP